MEGHSQLPTTGREPGPEAPARPARRTARLLLSPGCSTGDQRGPQHPARFLQVSLAGAEQSEDERRTDGGTGRASSTANGSVLCKFLLWDCGLSFLP